MLLQLSCKLRFAKKQFDPSLGIIKIAFNRNSMDIIPPRRRHLQALGIADPAMGIKDDDFCIRHITESGHSRFSRIAACRNENHALFLFARLADGSRKEMRQDLECHILKGTRWTMP